VAQKALDGDRALDGLKHQIRPAGFRSFSTPTFTSAKGRMYFETGAAKRELAFVDQHHAELTYRLDHRIKNRTIDPRSSDC